MLLFLKDGSKWKPKYCISTHFLALLHHVIPVSCSTHSTTLFFIISYNSQLSHVMTVYRCYKDMILSFDNDFFILIQSAFFISLSRLLTCSLKLIRFAFSRKGTRLCKKNRRQKVRQFASAATKNNISVNFINNHASDDKLSMYFWSCMAIKVMVNSWIECWYSPKLNSLLFRKWLWNQ